MLQKCYNLHLQSLFGLKSVTYVNASGVNQGGMGNILPYVLTCLLSPPPSCFEPTFKKNVIEFYMVYCDII